MTVKWVPKKYFTVIFFDDAITQAYFKYSKKDAQLPLRNAFNKHYIYLVNSTTFLIN